MSEHSSRANRGCGGAARPAAGRAAAPAAAPGATQIGAEPAAHDPDDLDLGLDLQLEPRPGQPDRHVLAGRRRVLAPDEAGEEIAVAAVVVADLALVEAQVDLGRPVEDRALG